MHTTAFLNFRDNGGNWDSSDSMVSDYRLDYRATAVLSPAEARDFFPSPLCPDQLCVPPSLLFNGYGAHFPGSKARPGRNADHSLPSSAEIKNEHGLYFLSPLYPA
jgi:hypothetical protein